MNYQVGEKILCYHGPHMYEAKVRPKSQARPLASSLDRFVVPSYADSHSSHLAPPRTAPPLPSHRYAPIRVAALRAAPQVLKAEIWTGQDPSEGGFKGPHYRIHYQGWKAT